MTDNDDILMQAAKAALAKLPQLEAELIRLHSEIQRVSTKVNQYKNIIASADLPFPDPVSIVEPISTGMESGIAVADKKATKGECMRHIDNVLTSSLTPVNALQVAIHQKHSALYGVSTLYANLQRGQKEGRYVNEEGKWRKA